MRETELERLLDALYWQQKQRVAARPVQTAFPFNILEIVVRKPLMSLEKLVESQVDKALSAFERLRKHK